MKKLCLFFLLLVLFIIPSKVSAEENLISGAKSGLLMEVSTGKILFEKNIDDKQAVASMTKMMSQILILEQIESGKLKWDKIVKVSSNAAGYGGSQIYLQPGEEMTVRDIFKGISMASANDGTVALAEEIAGSESKFVDMMNKKAKDLKLANTVFKNCTGLDEEGHVSTSRDMAIIARELLTKHSEILNFSSVYEDYLRKDTPNKFWLVNTNKLVRLYDGTDGLKTGHTDNAGYCMAVTAKRDDMRILVIVLGEEDSKQRNKEVSELLDYGFNNYKLTYLKKKNEVIKTKKLDKSNVDKINIYLKDDVTVLEKKGDEDKKYTYNVKIDDIKLPINKGDSVGKIEILLDNKKVDEKELTINQNLKKLNIFKLYLRYLKKVIC